MPTPMVIELFKQLFKTPATNKFPVKYVPPSVTAAVKLIEEGKLKITPPVETPPKFRGKLTYDRDKCTGCGICVRVCPSLALVPMSPEGEEPKQKKKKGKKGEDEAKPKKPKMKVKHYVSRCTFCSQCVDVCPTDAFGTEMSDVFMMADTNKFSEQLIVE